MQEFLQLIEEKRLGKAHSLRDIAWIINNLDNLPDEQLAAWLMAVCNNGLSETETTELTRCMAYSGHVLTLQRCEDEEGCESKRKVFVDKHSTGGVGDKVSLVLSPLLASLGFYISKFSGRSLGHTGGTIDKLESIPGFRTDISMKQFETQIEKIGIVLAAQTMEFAPADKRLYALRNKTGTIDSIPLIAASVMSKKIAGGADTVILDVKLGEGAFMKDLKAAKELAKTMIKIGKGVKLDVKALITNMDQPLGYSVGNMLEVQEAISVLKGKGSKADETGNDFYELVMELGSTIAERKKLEEAIANGSAYKKFVEWIEAQGGDLDAFEKSTNDNKIHRLEVKATEEGHVKELDALEIGLIAKELSLNGEKLDYSAGLTLNKKIGDKLEEGEVIFTLQGQDISKLEAMKERALKAYLFSKFECSKPKLVLAKL